MMRGAQMPSDRKAKARQENEANFIELRELEIIRTDVLRDLRAINRTLGPIDADIKILKDHLLMSWWPRLISHEDAPRREIIVDVPDPQTGEIATETIRLPVWPKQPPPINLEGKQYRASLTAECDEIYFSHREEFSERDQIKERIHHLTVKIDALARRIATYRKNASKDQQP